MIGTILLAVLTVLVGASLAVLLALGVWFVAGIFFIKLTVWYYNWKGYERSRRARDTER